MNAGIVEQVKDALAPVAEKLQQGAEFMYRVYFQQTIADALIQIGGALLAIALILVTAKVVKGKVKPEYFNPSLYSWDRREKEDVQKMYAENVRLGVTVASIVISGLVSIAIFDGARKLINPHFYTIDRIIQSVKDKEIK